VSATEESALEYIERCIRKIDDLSLKVSEIQKKKFNFEVEVIDDRDKLKLLVYFGKNGIKSLLQGNKESRLYNVVNKLLFSGTLFESTTAEDFTEPENYIGTDESGKGDYFGPLVIAGVFVNENTRKQLRSIDVKDSKELSDNSIERIAGEIKKIIKNDFEIILITPKKYNELYAKIRNVNRLLAWGHAKVLENLLQKCNAKEAISDKFGDESLIKNSLQEKGGKILLHQFTKAEKYTAVAAASILARQKFVEWFDVQNNLLKFNLPKGASNKVIDAALQIRKTYGEEKLSELVKLHFKTTLKVVSN